MSFRMSRPDDLDAFGRGIEEDIAASVTGAITDSARDLKAAWREQIEGARLGPRLARTIQTRIYPPGQPSIDAAALVWTKAPKIIDSYARGPTIVARNGGRFLAIPTDDVPKKRQGNRLTPDEVETRYGRRLQFISARENFWSPSVRKGGAVGYLIMKGMVPRKATGRWRNASQREMTKGARRYDKAISTVIFFVLVPQVRVTKRLDLEALAREAEAAYPARLTQNWR